MNTNNVSVSREALSRLLEDIDRANDEDIRDVPFCFPDSATANDIRTLKDALAQPSEQPAKCVRCHDEPTFDMCPLCGKERKFPDDQPAKAEQPGDDQPRPRGEPCTDPECGCMDPTFTDPIEALRFLSGRFKYAGVSHPVAKSYARDIDKILAALSPSVPAVAFDDFEGIVHSEIDNLCLLVVEETKQCDCNDSEDFCDHCNVVNQSQQDAFMAIVQAALAVAPPANDEAVRRAEKAEAKLKLVSEERDMWLRDLRLLVRGMKNGALRWLDDEGRKIVSAVRKTEAGLASQQEEKG